METIDIDLDIFQVKHTGHITFSHTQENKILGLGCVVLGWMKSMQFSLV